MAKKIIYLMSIFITLSFLSCGDSESESKKINEIETKSTMETCPHCSGLGRRVNHISGQMGDCGSCGGDGRVTSDQYSRLSK